MKDALIVTVLSVVPKRLGSRLQGAFARLGLTRHLIGLYVRAYGVDTDEIEGEVADYDSLQAFFVRGLREGARPLDTTPDALVSPCDGRVYAVGTLDDAGHLPPDAGIDFDVSELLGASGFAGGPFAVLYLSPTDYHRVHHPREGVVTALRYLPGALWPVFDEATRRVPGLFAKNERMAIFVRTDRGPQLAVVMVGAYGVGRMSLEWTDWVSNQGMSGGEQHYDPSIPAERGAELGRFNLGSTVILVGEPGAVQWEIAPGERVAVRQRIGRLDAAE